MLFSLSRQEGYINTVCPPSSKLCTTAVDHSLVKMASSLQPWYGAPVVLLLCLRLSAIDASAGGPRWNYAVDGDFGPAHWAANFSKCGGKMQSPIDVNTSTVLYSPQLKFFDFSGYNVTSGVNISLENLDGQTAEVIYSGKALTLKGGGLPGEYQLAQFHFHWGDIDTRGSEHYINGDHFPMELHLVHYQVGYSSASEARVQPYGLAVVGFFFEVSKENNTALDELLKHFDNIKMAGNTTELDSFSLLDLLPEDYQKLHFYRYYGSLTTPPCYETVIWSLVAEHLNISEYQLNIFRNLYSDEDQNQKLVNDFRPIQELDERIVVTNLRPKDADTDTTTTKNDTDTTTTVQAPIQCTTLKSPNSGALICVHQLNIILSVLATVLYIVH
ncbi:Carbonic anhydrase 14 [Bulinus truncatus]|nr:Carbonic anhydrase 14 [Bulinus truncatus]